MDLRELEYLTALSEEGSVSRAADRLYMSQSSLSQFLQQYEDELGVRLFLRTSKGIRPTTSGELFIEHMQRILLDYQRARNELWDNESMKGGRVLLGISSFRGYRMLPKILHRFRQMYPDVTVDVVEENSLRLEALLLDGKLDVAVIALPARKLKNEVRFLKKEEVYIVASADHPLLRKAQKRDDGQDDWVTLKDVAGYPLILSNHDTILGNLSRNLLRSHRCKYKAIYENITAEMAVCMAREGLGLAFTYASCTEPDERTRLLRIGSDGVFLDLGIGFPSREYHSRSAEALEAVIMDVYSES